MTHLERFFQAFTFALADPRPTLEVFQERFEPEILCSSDSKDLYLELMDLFTVIEFYLESGEGIE
jgi:hypothetical protein